MSAVPKQRSFGKIIGNALRIFAPKDDSPQGYESRFDIDDHGIALPDMAKFPEFSTLKAFPENTAIERDLHQRFRDAFLQSDVELFNQSVGRLQNTVEDFLGERSEADNEILRKQFKNIGAIARWFIGYKKVWGESSRDDIPSSPIFEALQSEGVYGCHIDTSVVNALIKTDIQNLLSQEVTNICKPGEGYDRSKMLFNDGSNDSLFTALRNEIGGHGILSAASKHHNSSDLDFKHACLHVCTPNDTHFTQTLQDCQTTSKLIGLHVDPKPVIKIIVYLNDVTATSGPFTFIPESHRWRYDETEMICAKGNSTGNYLHSPEHRRIAAAFPPVFRRNAIIGRFILDGTPESERLLATERSYTSDVANCITFDPGNGLHRGGICTSGNRINLQIALH